MSYYAFLVQFNSLVLSGPVAALTKYLVEFFQVGIARGSRRISKVWLALEAVNTTLAACPLIAMHAWREVKAQVRAYEAF